MPGIPEAAGTECASTERLPGHVIKGREKQRIEQGSDRENPLRMQTQVAQL